VRSEVVERDLPVPTPPAPVSEREDPAFGGEDLQARVAGVGQAPGDAMRVVPDRHGLRQPDGEGGEPFDLRNHLSR
jgi:hypothetical protein